MKRLRILLLLATLPCFSWFLCAQAETSSQESLEKENSQLRQEVKQLRSELDDVRQALAELKEAVRALSAQPAPAPAAAPNVAPAAAPVAGKQAQAAPSPAPAAPKPELPNVKSKYKLNVYGYVKLDAATDTSRVNTGNFARWVESESTNVDDAETNINVNETRVGLDFSGPDIGKAKTTAKIEMDFAGGGTDNKPVPMLRHGYMQIEWPDHDFALLAGQTWDVISPIFPTQINYAPSWWCGNIGYRHPQVQVRKGFKLGNDTRLVFQGAMSRTMGASSVYSPGDTGEDSVVPTFQGRVGLTFPTWGKNKATLGVSGHWGRNEIDLNASGANVRATTWSGNVDLYLPLGHTVVFKAEIFRGADVETFLGGIGQGINMTTFRPIATTGGWVTLGFGPFDKWRFHIGGAIDDPNDDDLNAGDRTLNESYYSNVIYQINEAITVGFEVTRWHTGYKLKLPGDAWRFQTSFIYRF